MDKNIIDEETFLFIYKNVCIMNDIPFDNLDITDEDIYLSSENYKLIYLINRVVSSICVKTNRNQFPSDLKYLVIDLVNSIYTITNEEKSPEVNQNINSMSESGRSVSFGATDTWKTKYNSYLDQQIKDNETLINKYKLLYKVRCPYAKN